MKTTTTVKYFLIVVGEDDEDATQNIDKTIVLVEEKDIQETVKSLGPTEYKGRLREGVYRNPTLIIAVELYADQAAKLKHNEMSEGRTFTG